MNGAARLVHNADTFNDDRLLDITLVTHLGPPVKPMNQYYIV